MMVGGRSRQRRELDVIASTDTGWVEMRVSKVVALGPGRGEEISHFVVLDEAQGDRHVVILIGPSEAGTSG
jgi:hypothetical protein